MDLLKRNIASNFTTLQNIEIKELFWGNPLDEEIQKIKFDLILGADIVYEIQHFDLLITTLKDLTTHNPKMDSTNHQTTILLAMEHRWKDVENYFFSDLEKNGFKTEIIPQEQLHRIYRHPKIDVYRIQRK